jgi:hypothetical protein
LLLLVQETLAEAVAVTGVLAVVVEQALLETVAALEVLVVVLEVLVYQTQLLALQLFTQAVAVAELDTAQTVINQQVGLGSEELALLIILLQGLLVLQTEVAVVVEDTTLAMLAVQV